MLKERTKKERKRCINVLLGQARKLSRHEHVVVLLSKFNFITLFFQVFKFPILNKENWDLNFWLLKKMKSNKHKGENLGSCRRYKKN